MNNRTPILFSLLALLALLLSACGAAAATQAPVPEEPPAQGGPSLEFPNAYAEPQSSDSSRAGVVPAGQPAPETKALPLPTAGVVYTGQGAPGANPDAGRMIIKNADMRLQVEDTDVAIDRTTQLAGDLGGYIVSSRTWVQSYYEYNLKYATITIGLPVAQFERGLTRYGALLRFTPSSRVPVTAANVSRSADLTKDLSYWSDGTVDRPAFLSSLLKRLAQSNWRVRTDSGWSSYDVEIAESR